MELEDLIDAHLAGDSPDVPADLRDAYERAVAAHRALCTALTEATAGPGDDRRPPARSHPVRLGRDATPNAPGHYPSWRNGDGAASARA